MTDDVLVATPCYGGQLSVGYLRGLFEIQDSCASAGIGVGFLVTEGESAVNRARNNLAATFLDTGYRTLAFIDADIEMQGSDFIRLARMSGVRGAAVCMKGKPGVELLSCWVGSDQMTRAQMPPECFPVDWLGAAVLFIDRGVFVALSESGAAQPYDDAGIGAGHEYFPTGVVDRTLLTEDYGFCYLCKQAGIEIACDPQTVVKHYGSCFWQA